MSLPKPTHFKHSVTPSDKPRVVVLADARRTRGVFVRLPVSVLDRLKKQTEGGHTVAIAALVDWALDHLQQKGRTLTVRPRD